MRVTFRVDIGTAAGAIADWIISDPDYEDPVETAGKMSRKGLEQVLRSNLTEEGHHIYFVSEKHEGEDCWGALVETVAGRLIELGMFPADSEAC